MVSRSCANTTTPPSGGPKDTIPPELVQLVPENSTKHFPRTGQKIKLTFNEYTVIKDQNEITLSPPHRKKPTAKVKGKSIEVTFNDTLREECTYTIDFGEALVDNNESNPAPRLIYAFSTGDSIDSMYFTGTVRDYKTLAPVKKALVAIYSDLSDSACLYGNPAAAVKSDEWGYFVFRNVKSIPYRLYAYSDVDNDFAYNPDSDEIAFCDTVIVPVKVIGDSIPELGHFNMKDTLECLGRKADVKLNIFKEHQTKQYLQNSGRKSEKYGFLKFSAGDVQINSIDFWGIDKEQVILQYNQARDSIDFWIDSKYRLPDSLIINLNYKMTDSLGVLVDTVENLSLAIIKEKDSDAAGGITAKGSKQKDTVFNFKVDVKKESIQTDGFSIEHTIPVKIASMDSVVLVETNPKGQKSEKPYRFFQDSTELRRYWFLPEDKLIVGYEYTINIPQGSFIDIEGLPNKAEEIKFEVPKDEKLSFLTLDFKECDCNYIVELTNDKGDTVIKTLYINEDKSAEIQYLKAGKYMIRITRDVNGNRLLDTGNLLSHIQPEEVRFYEYEPEKSIIEIPESTEIVQEINFKKLFFE